MDEMVEIMDFSEEIEKMKKETNYNELISVEPEDEKPQKDTVIMEKPKKNKKREKQEEIEDERLTTFSSLYDNQEDYDKNEFILEGCISQLYTPANKEVTFLEISCPNEETGIKNLPQIKIFKSFMYILKDIKKGDYVRVIGKIFSQKRNLPDKTSYMESIFVARTVHKVSPPVKSQESFFERFEINDTERVRRANNYAIISGVVSDVRINGKSAKNGIRFKITSHWGKNSKGIMKGTMVAYYYVKENDIANVFEHIYAGNRICAVGEIQTRRVLKTGSNPIYTQNFVVKNIGSIKKGR